MQSSHLVLCRPLLLLPSVFSSIRVFSSVNHNLPIYLSPPFLLGSHKFVFSICGSSFCKLARLCHFLDSTCKWYHDICLSVWLPSLGVIISTSIHVIARGIISFFLAECYSVVYTYHIIFTCSSVDGIYVTPVSWLLCLVLQGTLGACIFLDGGFLA